MPGSSTSLDSLSSPSPSPSPPPDTVSKAEPNSAGLDGDSELSELTEDEQDDQPHASGSSRGGKRGRNNTGNRRGGASRRARKRSSLVPPRMWGWADTGNRTTSAAEEEEEEERNGAPTAMEEEEGEDELVDSANADKPLLPIVADDELDHSISLPPPSDHQSPDSAAAPDMPPTGEDVPPALALAGLLAMAEAATETESQAAKPAADDELVNSDDEASDDEPAEPGVDPDDNDTESEDEQPKEEEEEEDDDDDDDPKAAGDDDADEDVDVTAPLAAAVAPIVAAASASSIMAGSAVVDPASPSSSVASSRSQTPASSRSPSPAPVPKTPATTSLLASAPTIEPPIDNEEEEEEEEIDELAVEEEAPPPKRRRGKGRGKQKPQMRIQVEMEPDQDMEVDADVTPDDDMGNEMESELLPAHRAEALDVLASIEFKFGRLRETLYVERMEQLAWEESLIIDGTHPELLHYQKELSSRRDKRIELASRKRELEIATIQKKRRVNEDGTWSWWQHERDQLQTDMIAENNRKKRKLERERRAVERPQPVRRIPHPPVDVPPAPTLREIADSFPFSDRPSKRRKLTDVPSRNVYPELSTLSNAEVNSDLEFLYSLRRPAYEPRMPSGSHLNGLPMAGPMYDSFPPDNFPPRDRMPPPPGYAHHVPQPPPPGLQAGPSSVPPFPFNSNSHSAGGRGHHHHHPGPASNPSSIHNPPGNSIHGPSPFAPMDPDIPGPHSHYGSTTQPPPPGFHGPGSSRRSSMSPAPSTFAGKGTGQWMGAGMGMPMFNLGGPSKGPPADWITDSRQEDERREREHRERDHREREAREARDKEYDRREREREHYRQLDRDRERDESLMAQQQQQQQIMHRHSSHSHTNPVHAHHHHRPHHHHVVHHHHTGMGPSSAGPSLSPRAAREYDRPHSRPNAEIINLSAPKSSVWKGDEPPQRRPMSLPDERDRPAAVPFAMGAPPHRTNSPRASWSVPDGYRDSPGHRYPPALSSSSRPPLPNPLSVSPQTRTLPPPTSPNRYRDDLPPKKLLPPLDGRPPVDPKNGMRMNEIREKDRMLSSPPPRMNLPPRVPQLVDGS